MFRLHAYSDHLYHKGLIDNYEYVHDQCMYSTRTCTLLFLLYQHGFAICTYIQHECMGGGGGGGGGGVEHY